jgi:hypothetical protein
MKNVCNFKVINKNLHHICKLILEDIEPGSILSTIIDSQVLEWKDNERIQYITIQDDIIPTFINKDKKLKMKVKVIKNLINDDEIHLTNKIKPKKKLLSKIFTIVVEFKLKKINEECTIVNYNISASVFLNNTLSLSFEDMIIEYYTTLIDKTVNLLSE